MFAAFEGPVFLTPDFIAEFLNWVPVGKNAHSLRVFDVLFCQVVKEVVRSQEKVTADYRLFLCL